MTNHRRIALALNNLATVLQQLAVELADEEVVHPQQLTTAQLREALLAPPSREELGQHLRDARPEPPASVAEPVCECSLYTRCEQHSRDPRCKCNGPRFRASSCLQSAHREEARAKPDRDPALVD